MKQREIIVSAAMLTGLVLGLVSGLMLFGGGGSRPPGDGSPADMGGGPPPALVRLGEVKMMPLQQRFEVVGRLREVQQTTVAAEVAGKVIRVPVDEGDVVAGGETVLAQIDGVWAKLDLAAAQADVEAATANLDQARRDMEQLEQLLRARSAKPKEVEDARSEVKTYTAELERAAARRDRARQEVERLQVIAPFDGIVTEKHVEVGQWVERGSGVIGMISHGRIDAVIDVPERYINQVEFDEQVEVVVEPLAMTVTGSVVAINPQGRNAARTFPVKIRLDDHDNTLKPGMSIRARVPMDKMADTLTVPRDAVIYTTQGSVVWAAIEQAAGMMGLPLPVQVLFSEDGRYAVESQPSAQGMSLQAGMQVVIEGAERLFPTQPLMTPGMQPAAHPGDSPDSPSRSTVPADQPEDAGDKQGRPT